MRAEVGAVIIFFIESRPFSFVVVVHHVDVIDFVQVLRLPAHFAQAGEHRPVLVHHHQLLCHQTAGGIVVIVQKVHDVARLLQVLHVRQHLVLLLVGHAGHQVGGVVRVHVVDEPPDDLRGEGFDEMHAFLLVDFRQHVARLLVVEQEEHELCPFVVQLLQNLGDVRRVEFGNESRHLRAVFRIDQLRQPVEELMGQFEWLHISWVSCTKSWISSCSGRRFR